MHIDNQMTTNERFQAYMAGKPLDKLLAMPVLVSMSSLAAAMTHEEKSSTALNKALAQVACYERAGNDLTITVYGLHGVGQVLGSRMSEPEDAVPGIEYTLMDINGVDQLDIAMQELKSDASFLIKGESVSDAKDHS